ncbi:hypothetical protein ACHQM5_010154 [Ranunculus cassubicifolius]
MSGEVPVITLPKAAVKRGRDYCQFSLIGRLDFKKISIVRLTNMARETWRPSGEWKVILLGRVYFMLRLHSQDDCVRIWSQPWKIGQQLLRFTKWLAEFDPDKERSKNTLLG